MHAHTDRHTHVFTSESVSEGHPDKVADTVADSILDAFLEQDPRARVACEVLCKGGELIVAGEISSTATVDLKAAARRAIAEIGYMDLDEPFSAGGARIQTFVTEQAPEIGQGVSRGELLDQGAGDQGMMFGYATDETPELMPLPILLAHRLALALRELRRGAEPWLRPDAKTQVSVRYEGDRPVAVTDMVVSTQHARGVPQARIRELVLERVAPLALRDWWHPGIRVLVNPTGSFEQGGPSADAGVTGRKIIVDTYGGMARVGGGAFSGKDPSKVDRSGAYFARYAARRVVEAKLARRAEIQVAYAIGVAQPVSISVDTFGTGDARGVEAFLSDWDFRPGAIIAELDLLRPIYRSTTNYGHFGKSGLPWERPTGSA